LTSFDFDITAILCDSACSTSGTSQHWTK